MFIRVGVRYLRFDAIDEIEDRSLDPNDVIRKNAVFVYLRNRGAYDEVVFEDEEADEFRRQFNALANPATVKPAEPTPQPKFSPGDRVKSKYGATGTVVGPVEGYYVRFDVDDTDDGTNIDGSFVADALIKLPPAE